MQRRIVAWMALAGMTVMMPLGRCEGKPERRTFHLQWRDLDRATRGHRIGLALPSEIRLEGDVVAFEQDELVLDVRKTSNRRAYPKGRAIIPRAEVTRLRVIKTRHGWRMAGTAIGGGVGGAIAVPMAALAGDTGYNAALVGCLTVAVPAGVGYLLGWATDVNVVEIVVERGP